MTCTLLLPTSDRAKSGTASSVDFDLELRLRTCFSLTFSGVPNGNQGGASDCEAGGDADTSSDDDGSSESDADDGEDIDDVEPGPDGNQDPQSHSSDPGHGGVLQQGVFAEELTKVCGSACGHGLALPWQSTHVFVSLRVMSRWRHVTATRCCATCFRLGFRQARFPRYDTTHT